MSQPLALRLTAAAVADLDEIWATIAVESSVSIADRFTGKIYKAFTRLQQFPLSGPARKHVGAGVRVVFHTPYAIYYAVQSDAVAIVRVVHGARDLRAGLGDR